MKTSKTLIVLIMTMLLFSCQNGEKNVAEKKAVPFKYQVDQFADLKIMRYQVPGFDALTLQQKKLLYYLSQATLAGRDIIWDQNYKYNLAIRKTLEEIYKNYNGDKTSEDWKSFMVYLKRVWFSNGIHHHYSMDKIMPTFPETYFTNLFDNSPGSEFPLMQGQDKDSFKTWVTQQIFDPNIAPKRVSLDPGKDMVTSSACNFYEDVTQKEAEDFYSVRKDPSNPEPISYGLNSKLVNKDGELLEEVYKIDGLYGQAISKIVGWLEKAAGVAESPEQKAGLEKLIQYYRNGDLKTWDQYNVLWVQDLKDMVDYVNGFIETYGDPLGMKATWEAISDFKDLEGTKRAEIISSNAQWFEDHSPIDPRFRKEKVKGVSAKVITVVQLGGDCDPSTPIGINLPNADWIRKDYGSKSVTMDNITYAYDQASLGNGFLEEFCASPEEVDLANKYGYLAGNLHTDMHECLGHASGQLLPGTSSEALKNYSSTLEEARADLFALYYLMDPIMEELELMPNQDVAKTEYNSYIRNGLLTQLTRIEPGKNIEESHMRNRQLISMWCYEKGKADSVIVKIERNGKTYFQVKDYQKLRELFGKLLAEIQRIKSEGDYEAGKALVENYGVKVDQKLLKEVKERYAKLKLAPYGGFINPILDPLMEDGKIVDVKLEYPDDFAGQMMYYSKNYSYLPVYNN